MKDKYSIYVFWYEEDGCFIATCPEFPLLSAHGETREEATSEFQTVLEMAFESYKEDGIELPTPKTSEQYSGQFRIRMPKTLHRGLVESADREGVSLNTYAVSLLAEKHAIKNVISEKIEIVDRIIQHLTGLVVYHQQKLQVFTQQLNFKKHSHHQLDVPPAQWRKAGDDVSYIVHTVNQNHN